MSFPVCVEYSANNGQVPQLFTIQGGYVIVYYISEGSVSHINGVRPGFLEIQLFGR